MDELDIHLVRCISSIFPNLTEEEIRSSDLSQLMRVDSLAAVTLLTVIDEEFGVNLDLEGLLSLDSFQAVGEHLREHGSLNLHSNESSTP